MRFIIDYFREFFEDYFQERRREKVNDKAYELAQQEKFAEAAEVYIRFAPELLKYSSPGYGQLMYCVYCHYAFEMWIKAKDAGNALQQARNALRVLSSNDGSWLKYDSGKQAEKVLAMIGELYIAGYTAEADLFSKEVNEQLEKYDVPLRSVVGPVRESGGKFPSLCPHCGAKLPSGTNKAALECSYCETVTYAQ